MRQLDARQLTACFFARVPDTSYLERNEFYKQDIDVLHALGFKVRTAIRWRDIPGNADLYFVWWWTWAFLPLVRTLGRRRPTLITGSFDHWSPESGWEYDSRPFWEKALIQYALRSADANVFVSNLEFERIPKKLRVSNPYYSPHVVNTSVYKPGSRGREDFVFTVAWLEGQNAVRKCIPEIIQSVPLVRLSHPNVRFLIAGVKGSYYPRLAQLAENLGVADQVEFLGAITREQKIDLMQRCAIYLQPTVYEGFGLATLEAMSCGAPVISSAAGAVPEVVGSAGVLLEGHSPTEIARAVDDLLANEGAREELGQQGRRRAESVFPCDRRKRDLKAIISRLLDRNRSTKPGSVPS